MGNFMLFESTRSPFHIGILSYHDPMRYIPALFLGALVLTGVISMGEDRAPYTSPQSIVSSAYIYYEDPSEEYTYESAYYYEKPYYSEGGYYGESAYYDDTYYDYDDTYYEYYDDYVVVDPWYVRTFPGFGRMAQYIIPGQLVTRPVVQPPAPKSKLSQPSCWISVQPTEINPGGSSVLAWSSFNTTHAILSGIGDVPISGSRTVSGITSTRNFVLQVVGQGGSNSCYGRVTVRNISTAPTCIISANPNTITRGQSTNLAWGSQGALSASLSNFGLVPVQSGLTILPYQSTTYFLTVTSASGERGVCSTEVNVQ